MIVDVGGISAVIRFESERVFALFLFIHGVLGGFEFHAEFAEIFAVESDRGGEIFRRADRFALGSFIPFERKIFTV